jgi:hypothetical protein
MLPSRRLLLSASLGTLLSWLMGPDARGSPNAGQTRRPPLCPLWESSAGTFLWTSATSAAWSRAANWQRAEYLFD